MINKKVCYNYKFKIIIDWKKKIKFQGKKYLILKMIKK